MVGLHPAAALDQREHGGSEDDRRDDELQALLEKSSDADLLREMIGSAAHRLMELEVENLTGAAHAAPIGSRSATGIASATGRPAPRIKSVG